MIKTFIVTCDFPDDDRTPDSEDIQKMFQNSFDFEWFGGTILNVRDTSDNSNG